ncbi:MAG: DUF3570 domain-containing protein [Salegentibacter sp.]
MENNPSPNIPMRKLIALPLLLCFSLTFAQNPADSTSVYKKRVLQSSEVDFLSSYYSQDGDNASVSGGIGSEKLTDFTPTVVVRIPLNDDDVLSVDAGISAYTSASSSNLNPFDGRKGGSSHSVVSGASQGYVVTTNDNSYSGPVGSPWVASSGASQSDTWAGATLGYSHSSDSRNTVWDAELSVANEFDYSSFGFGGGITQLFNEKNTTVGLNAKVYLDSWNPRYPTELDSYLEVGGNLNAGFFSSVNIWDQQQLLSNDWHPVSGFALIDQKSRNSYSLSLSLSQILNKNAQVQLIFDVVKQQGWLANPMQRVYFQDVPNYYIGNPESIPYYTTPRNRDVFQLADDFERLPDSRLKFPVGIRFNYFINEILALRTYYRYYTDDWGVHSNTAQLEIPVKISDKFTLYPSYRYYDQTAADYFAPYEQHVSTEQYYTSDYDLSKFQANQYGFGINYTDIFTKFHIWQLGLKSIDLKYNHYSRDTGLSADIISGDLHFVLN